jgi:hypothetical protein
MPAVLWATVIFLFSSVPDLKSGLDCDYALRKFAHAAEYGILCALVLRAFSKTVRAGGKFRWYALAVTVLYAFSDEYHQSFVPGRFCSLADVLIDATGACAALYVLKKGDRLWVSIPIQKILCK